MMRHIDAALTVAFCERYRNRHHVDVAELVAIAILHRVFRVEFKLKQGHTERRRYGVRPSDVLIESDSDKAS